MKLRSHFVRYKIEYISVLTLWMATLIILVGLLRLWNITPTIPLQYSGSDEMFTLANAKMLISQNWVFSSDRLGAPFGATFYDVPNSMFHNIDLLFLKILCLVTKNIGLSVNILYLSTFFIIAAFSYYVMRELKIVHWISICFSLVYTFMPYIFMKNISSIALSSYYLIPISFLICFWIYEQDDILQIKNFFKNKKNILVIVFTVLIANNGVIYYPFFTGFIVLITGISKTVKVKSYRGLLKGVFITLILLFCSLLNSIPSILHNNYAQNAATLNKGIDDVEIYALKMIQMFVPVDNHNIHVLKVLIDEYNTLSFYINENVSSYLGIIGIVGFLILILKLFIKREDGIYNKLTLLSELNITMLFLGVTGGLSSLVDLFITDKIRYYNRISIFIAFGGILTVALILNEIYKKYNRKRVIILGVIVSLIVIWEQFPRSVIPDYDLNFRNYIIDDNFIHMIESNVKPDASIYQLSNQIETDSNNRYLLDNKLYIGFIHSDKLKWSYGSVTERDNFLLNNKVASTTEDTIKYVKESGYSGIYIDRRSYTEQQIKELEDQLTKELGVEPIYSENSNLSFYKIQ